MNVSYFSPSMVADSLLRFFLDHDGIGALIINEDDSATSVEAEG